MVKRMLVDATHPEETRVAIVESNRNNNRLEDLDYALASKPILRGNIYLAKVMRIEPSLQAAFVEYGGNRHGFLPFSEIHPDYFRIPVADRAEEEITETPVETTEISAEEVPVVAAPTQEAPAEEIPPKETPVEEAAAKPEATGTFAQTASDEDATLGLITDFGNAAIIDDSSLTEIQTPQAPPEDVGGDNAERIVRAPRPRYKIQEVLKRGQVMLIQVVKEERGNKGAALTSFLSLAGRYCVLMPNTDHGGGVSRKITNHQDRRRMKEILDQLKIPDGMAVILRTAGMQQEPPDIQRDLEYLLSMWDNIREETLQSSAPTLIYEEANLIKRSVRDLYRQNIDEILVAGRDGYNKARDFIRALIPDELKKIKYYEGSTPLFIRYQVENQIDNLHSPVAQLRSGGYLVINPTEALVSIDVNSGRATGGRHIEETALKTNLEAADEVARQLRLRDLAGLVVIDFIDMEDGRNNAAVERRIKEAMKNDRARLQIGRISPFGLLELSRQRLRPSLIETNFETCPHCEGMGSVRSADSAAFSVLRAIEEEALRGRAKAIIAHMPAKIAVYILNNKRDVFDDLQSRYGITISVEADETLPLPGYKIEKIKGRPTAVKKAPAVNADQVLADTERDMPDFNTPSTEKQETATVGEEEAVDEKKPRRRRRRNNRRRPRTDEATGSTTETETVAAPKAAADSIAQTATNAEPTKETADEKTDSENGEENSTRRRRRGRRGGRRRNNDRGNRRPEDKENTNDNGNAGANTGRNTGKSDNFVPTSIHEIDTTPKPMKVAAKSAPKENTRSSHEIINPPSDAPKGGWWHRITGQ